MTINFEELSIEDFELGDLVIYQGLPRKIVGFAGKYLVLTFDKQNHFLWYEEALPLFQ